MERLSPLSTSEKFFTSILEDFVAINNHSKLSWTDDLNGKNRYGKITSES